MRRSPRAERTRGALVAAGRRLFCERPVDAVTVDDIVQAAGVGKGSFYNHFADREALVRVISAEIRAGVERAIDSANADIEDPARRVARACCIYVRFALDEPERAGFLVRVHSGHTSLNAPLNRGLIDDISQGLRAGRFRIATLEAGVLFVLGVTQMVLTRVVQEPSAALAVSLAQQMCAMTLSGLRAPEADADLIAAQASEEIVRAGAYATAFAEAPATKTGPSPGWMQTANEETLMPGPDALTPFEGWDIRTLIDAKAAQRGDHPAMIWAPFEGAGRTWSYAQFAETLRRFAAGLQARGVGPGQRILVHLDNCPESIIAWLGCAYAGAVAVTTNARSSLDEVAYFARHSGAVGAITQPRFAALVAKAAPNLAFLCVTQTDNGAPAEADAGAYETFGAIDGDPAGLAERRHDPMAHFAIQYTSGTTARPKAVLWTHANALWGARVSAMHEDLRAEDVHLVYLPLFHTNAQVYSVAAALWAGASFVIQPKFSASRFWPVSLKYGCTWTSMVPFCIRALMEQPLPDAHSYRHFGNGVCSPPTDAWFGVKTIGWWGMTETITQGVVGSPHMPDTPLSMGRPSPAYEILVLDGDFKPVAPGGVGDLYVRGRRGLSLFLEYAGDPAATAAAFTPDGLFITGDKVRVGEDGFLYFADRSKDMLKVGGENVAASEIERVIAMVAGVKEVAVVARRHPMLDEVPVAFVIPVDEGEALVARILDACGEALAGFKRPHEVRLVESLPRSTLEKVAKAELRALLAGEQS